MSEGQHECESHGNTAAERLEKVCEQLHIALNEPERAFVLKTRHHFYYDEYVRRVGTQQAQENENLPANWRTLLEIIGEHDDIRHYVDISSEEDAHARAKANSDYWLAIAQRGLVRMLEYPLHDHAPWHRHIQTALRRVSRAPASPDRVHEYQAVLAHFTGTHVVAPNLKGLLDDILNDLLASDIPRAERHRDTFLNGIRQYRAQFDIIVATPDDICRFLLETKFNAVNYLLKVAEKNAKEGTDPKQYLGIAMEIRHFASAPVFAEGTAISIREPERYAERIQERVLDITKLYRGDGRE